MGLIYLGCLLVALGCMVLLDRRFTLFFWRDAPRAAIVLIAGMAFFVLWDLAGIGLDIFYRGDSPFMTGILLAPHLPVEEIFFLALLCYVTMIAYGAADAALRRRRKAGSE